MRCVLAFIVAHLGLLALVGAAPQVAIPLVLQQAPIARVGQDYVFSILPGSFASALDVNYTATALPAWLKFDSTNPTFYGRPEANDTGEHVVTLSAADNTGAANSSFTLIVSQFNSPVVTMDFDKQLADPKSRDIASATVMPGGHGVSVPPHWSFALGWNGNMFKRADSNNNGKLYYSAHVRGTTGLPAWLQFSNTTFTFNGVAPANGSYEVIVTGTDYWNHTAATSSFVFSVGTGSALENSKTLPDLKTVTRNIVNYPLDLSGMLLNGQKLDVAQVNASPDLSNLKWLSYNKATRVISGTTPDSIVNGTTAPYTIPVTLSSTNDSNTLSYISYLNVSVLPYSFTTFQLPATNVAAGQTFQLDISKYLVNHSSSVNASVIPAEAAQWLLYYPDNYTLVGSPPTNITYSAISVTFMATSSDVTSTTNVTMPIDGVTGPPGEGEPAPIPNAGKKGGLSTKNKIIIGVVVGVVGALILLAILLFCCCRRRDRSTPASPKDDLEKEGSPDTLVNTPGKKSFYNAGSAASSPKKITESPQRRFGIKGLFGTVDEPSLPTSDKSSYYARSDRSHGSRSFVARGELIGVNDPADVNETQSGITRSGPSAASLASWESGPSMHWSGEDEYLAPLHERDGFDALTPRLDGEEHEASPTDASVATPTFGATAALAAGPSAHRGRTCSDSGYVQGPDGDVPRPRAGFAPSYPRWIRKGDQVPALSSDNVSLYFSEFDHENSDRNMVAGRSLVTSRSLDSFAGAGSELVGTSSGSKHSGSASQSGSAWWKGSNLSSMLGRSSYSSEAIVATAQRQSLDTQRSSILPNEVIDFSSPYGATEAMASDASFAHSFGESFGAPSLREPGPGVEHSPAISSNAPTTPTRPVSYLVVPSYVGQMYTPPKNGAPSRRQSSSRRSPASVVPTRDNIIRGDEQAEVLYSAPLDNYRHAS